MLILSIYMMTFGIKFMLNENLEFIYGIKAISVIEFAEDIF